MLSDETVRSIVEIQQARSEYQIRRFVLGQHPTKEMQFYQCCVEIQDLTYKLMKAEIGRQLLEDKIERLARSPKRAKQLKADELRLDLEQQTLAEIGARRELEVFKRLFDEFPKFTREQIEQAQPEYWQRRLSVHPNRLQVGAHGWPIPLPGYEEVGIGTGSVKGNGHDGHELNE